MRVHLGGQGLRWALALLIGLSGCSTTTTTTALTTTTTAPTTTTVDLDSTSSDPDGTLHARLIGEWELVQAESEAFNPDVEWVSITATFTDTEMTGWESCAPYSAHYQLDGSRLEIIDWESTGEDCGDWTDDGVFVRSPTESLTVSFEGSSLVLTNSRWAFFFERVGP